MLNLPIDQITAEFDDICPPLSEKNVYEISSDRHLDLSMKKRSLSTSFDSFSSQSKLMKN